MYEWKIRTSDWLSSIKISVGISGLRGNRNDDYFILVLPNVPNNSSNTYSNGVQPYVIKFVSDLRQVGSQPYVIKFVSDLRQVSSQPYVIKFVSDVRQVGSCFVGEIKAKELENIVSPQKDIDIIIWLKQSVFLIGQNHTLPFLIKHYDHRAILHER